MKLWDIVSKVGGEIISKTVPGGSLILSAVNALLPDDKKLSENATGHQMSSAISGLPPEQQAIILTKEFEVELTDIKESNSTLRAMLEHDANNTHSTRPYIAKHAFHVIGLCVIMVLLLWSYAVSTENADMVKTIMDGWPFLLSVIGPLVSLLWAYFGVLKNEKKATLDAANNRPTGGLISAIGSLLKR